jgi:diacylglycerol kinase (ATP)
MKTCVVFNPAARGDKARLFQSQLANISRECTLKPTTHAGAARRLAAESVREGFEIIVAAGGDGTINEVLNGIADEPDGFARTRLAVLPLGTANVFAKELGLPPGFEAAWEVIRAGRTSAIDAPYARYLHDGKATRRYFAQLAGAGIDSRAIEMVTAESKKRFGWFAYIMAGFKTLAEQLPEIIVSNGRDTARGKLVLVGNGKLYGGRFPIFPLADMEDGVLDVVVYPRVNAEVLARVAWGMVTGDFHTGSRTVQLRASSLEMTSTSALPFQLDGENVAALPATFGIERRALLVVAP